MDNAEPQSLADLFDRDQPNHPALDAVLSGAAPGSAVADDASDPKNAFLLSAYGFAFASRDADPGFLERAVEHFRRKVTVVLIWPDEADTDLAPPATFLGTDLRYEYRDRADAVPPPPLPDSYTLQPMDTDLFAKCLWNGEVTRACGTAERFIETGLGWCVMHGDDLASESYSVFRGRAVHEIGVISARAHRGRGLAVHACHRLIEACEADGMGTYWSCNRDNPASNRVAGKLGFTDRRAYRFFVY
jgi:RimJ/RimL family protein N-acetyltransferase